MLVNNRSSYTIQSGGTYSPDAPIDINPESIGNSESSYRFVESIGGGSEITDYVSKTNGGVFDNLISYPSALSIVNDFNLVYKSWVVDEIDAKIIALGAGTVSSITAGNGMDFSTITTTGAVTLGTPSTLTLATTNALTTTSHTHALSGVQAYLDGTGFVKSTAGVISYDTNTYLATSAFNGLFDARFTTNFAASSLASLATRNHSNLNAIAGDGDGYHLSAGNYAIASRAATTDQSGYLTALDWNTFNNKLNAFTAGTGIDFDGEVISVNNSEIINDSGTSAIDIWSAEKVISYTTTGLNTYTIRLNAGTSLAQRLSGLIEGTDYPTGWVLSYSGASLIITHNLNILCTTLTTLSVNGTTSDAVKLEGAVAFSTFTNNYYTSGYNRITLDTFNVDGTEIYLKLIL